MEFLKKLLLGSVSKSVIRKLMVFVSGFLVGSLGLDPALVEKWCGSTETILIAVVLYLIAQVWSLAEKRLAKAVQR